jgi:hypothetical protein
LVIISGLEENELESQEFNRYLQWDLFSPNTNNKMRTQGEGVRLTVATLGKKGSSC